MTGLAQLLALGNALSLPPEPNSTINYTGPLSVTSEFEVSNSQKSNAFASSQIIIVPNGVVTLISRQGFFGPTSGVTTETLNNDWYAKPPEAPYNPQIGYEYEVRVTQHESTKTVEPAGAFPSNNPPVLGAWQTINAVRGWQLLVRGSENGGSFYANLQIEFRKIGDPEDYKSYNFYLSASVFIS